MNPVILEYIWLDGYAAAKQNDVANLRSKIKVMDMDDLEADLSNPSTYPNWSFDGSSTMQAEGHKSDCILKPVFVCPNSIDPLGMPAYFVLCEVLNSDGTPHATNTRAKMIEAANRYRQQDMWFAFEQEYAIFNRAGNWPMEWPREGYPSPQGRYYCGVGSDVSFGRNVSLRHLALSLRSGLPVGGTNAEVMPSQWEFQIGPGNAPEIADQMWMARYILNRVAEQEGVTIKLSPKPMVGDWNGTGCHINFSNNAMRQSLTQPEIDRIADALRANHAKHLVVYGEGNEKRLTGKHETCSINDFRIGESDRGASIRIPPGILQKGRGYLEDRRPAANIDPYQVCQVILETVCELYHTAPASPSEQAIRV